MDIEISKKTIGTLMAGFVLVVAFIDPMLALFFAVLTVFFLLFWHRHEERGNLDHFTPIQARRQKHLQDVLDLAYESEEIANNDVERALGVSDATATRYLHELEAEGLLVRHGDKGRGVTYRAVR